MIDEKEHEGKLKESQDKIYKIIFEKRNTRAHIKLAIKLSVTLILALIVGGIFSNLIIKYKYGAIIEQLQSSSLNPNMVILDYNYIAEKVEESIVIISNSIDDLSDDGYNKSHITGVIIDKQGTILTNYNTIKDQDDIYVKLCNGTEKILKAEIAVANQDMNYAIIKVKYSDKLKPIAIAKSDTIKVGQGIAVLNNSIIDDKIDSISPGIIMSMNQKDEYSLLKLSAISVDDNLGGIICNAKGELIGVAIKSVDNTTNNYDGIQYNQIEKYINSNDLIESVLGITDGDVILDESSEYKGFYVEQLEKNGNAYKAGIKPTDILLSINDLNIESVQEVTEVLRSTKIGDALKCKVLSNGKVKNIEIKLYK